MFSCPYQVAQNKSAWRAQTCSTRTWPWLACVFIVIVINVLLQRVKDKCRGKHAPHDIKLLPFDLIGPQEDLQQAAAEAVQAFPGLSMQYLVHNAGMLCSVKAELF